MKTFDKAEQTKQIITSKAKEVFIQKGYFQASMDDIRIHSGMSKGSIYYHFKNKEALFLYILEQYANEWIEKWNKKSEGIISAKEKLYLLAEHFASDYDSPLIRATAEFTGCESADPGVKEKLDELNKMYYPIVQDVMKEGIDNNEFTNIDINEGALITYAFLAGIGAVCPILNNTEVSHMYKRAVDIFLNGLGK